MRLRTLELRNYRRFRHAALEFPDGVIAITGSNGAGKSTLLEAVAWCLFGHDAARTQKELVKHSGAAPGDDVVVRLEFDVDGATYALTRRLRGKTQQAEAQLEADGVLQVAPGANSSDLASAAVERLLGVDRRGFQATVLSNQGDLSALSDAKPGERKRLILGLLGIDEVDAAIQAARTEKREAAIRLEETRRGLGREPDLRARRKALQADRDAAAGDHGRASLEATQRGTRVVTLRDADERLASDRARHVEVRGRLDATQRTLHLREEQRARLGAELNLLDQKGQELVRLAAQGPRWADLDERLGRLEEARGEARARDGLVVERAAVARDLERWQAVLRSDDSNGHRPEALDAEIARLRGRLEDASSRLVDLEAHARHADDDRRRLQAESTEAGERWRTIQELGPDAPCPLCERPLGQVVDGLARRAAHEHASVRERVEGMTREAGELRLQAEALRRTQEEARTTLAERERIVLAVRARLEQVKLSEAEARRQAQRLAQLDDALARTVLAGGAQVDERELERERAARGRWREQTARLEAEVSRAGRIRGDLAALEAQSQEARGEIEALTRELGALGYRDGAYEATHASLLEEERRLHDAERRRDVLAERLQGLDAQLAQFDQELERVDALRADGARLEAAVRIGELLAADRGDGGLLPQFKNHLIGRIRPALARAAGALVAEMTAGRYRELAVDDDYGMRLYDGAQALPLERFSGGENDVVHLAVRLAVNELLATARRARRLRFVALDEVLASLDTQRRERVLASLQRLGTHFRQVFLVTHLEEVRERVDHVIRVVPAPDGSSLAEASWTEKA